MIDWQMELNTKTPNLALLHAWLTANPQELPFQVESLKSSDDTFRYNAFQLAQTIVKGSLANQKSKDPKTGPHIFKETRRLIRMGYWLLF